MTSTPLNTEREWYRIDVKPYSSKSRKKPGVIKDDFGHTYLVRVYDDSREIMFLPYSVPHEEHRLFTIGKDIALKVIHTGTLNTHSPFSITVKHNGGRK